MLENVKIEFIKQGHLLQLAPEIENIDNLTKRQFCGPLMSGEQHCELNPGSIFINFHAKENFVSCPNLPDHFLSLNKEDVCDVFTDNTPNNLKELSASVALYSIILASIMKTYSLSDPNCEIIKT